MNTAQPDKKKLKQDALNLIMSIGGVISVLFFDKKAALIVSRIGMCREEKEEINQENEAVRSQLKTLSDIVEKL